MVIFLCVFINCNERIFNGDVKIEKWQIDNSVF